MHKILYKDYRNVIKNGKKIYTGYYIIYFLPWKKNIIKTAAKRKTGNAVRRNYEKRVIRNILRTFDYNGSYIFLIIVNKKNALTYTEKTVHFLYHLKKKKLINDTDKKEK